MNAKQLPRPIPDIDSAPYWDFARRQELRMQKCRSCGAFRFPPRAVCPKCRSFESEWALMSGRGRIYSWVIPHHPVHPAVEERVPYVIALVELDEGPRMVTNLIDCEIGDIRADMPVRLCWQRIDDELCLPQFAPAT